METDQRTAVRALGIAVAARIPVILWGGPGTGKSSAVRALSAALSVPCEVVIASIREPSDFAGLPIISNSSVHFAPPRWAQRLESAGKGILFLDEISTAPPAVQAALLRVVLERVVGDLVLPPKIAVVAAANPPEQTSDGWDLTGPLANRFCHIDWTANASIFSEGITAGWEEPRVPVPLSESESDASEAFGRVAAFIAMRPSLLSNIPREAAAAGRAWPSPRSWEIAAKLLAACEAADANDDVRKTLIVGAVGPGAGTEFLTWLDEMDLSDPEEALKSPESFDLPVRGDRAYAALAAVASAVAANPTEERWLAAWKILDAAGAQALDLAAVAARILMRCRPDGVNPPAAIERFAPLFAGLDTEE